MNKKLLFISKELIAADLAYILKKEGCEVKLFIEDKPDKDSFDGMVEKINNWEKELDWVGKDGLIVFDDVGYGEIQDDLRKKGYIVVGGGSEGDRLELDREYTQTFLKSIGMVPDDFETRKLSLESAIKFIKKNKGKWVIKQNDHNTELNYIGILDDGSDAIGILESYKNKFDGLNKISLQKKVEGIEIAIGRFFNGKDWVGPSVINFEHKHLCNDDIGPLGGETGTLMWYDDNDNNKLFKNTLVKIKDHLIKIDYRGYIDINCIVNKDKIYPLEITSRFGSSTIETQSEIHISSWYDFLFSIASGKKFDLKYKKGYALNVALTVPPFPYKTTDESIMYKGVQIYFTKKILKNLFKHIHFEGVKKDRDSYYVAGNSGYVLYVAAMGRTVLGARNTVYDIIKNISIPKMFYRTDIGLRFIKKDQRLLKKWGLI
jgi:phosphoribosylamine--glycine ligase